MASSSCLVKALFLDVPHVADYARCIRMLLSHNALDRRSRPGNVLERCLAGPENLMHSLAALVMETRCTFSPALVAREEGDASEGLRGDESRIAYLNAVFLATNISIFVYIMVPCSVFMATLPNWVPWVLCLALAFWFMGMRSARESLLVLLVSPVMCFFHQALM